MAATTTIRAARMAAVKAFIDGQHDARLGRDIKKEKLAEGIVGGRFEVQAAMQIADKFIAERAKRMGAGDD